MFKSFRLFPRDYLWYLGHMDNKVVLLGPLDKLNNAKNRKKIKKQYPLLEPISFIPSSIRDRKTMLNNIFTKGEYENIRQKHNIKKRETNE